MGLPKMWEKKNFPHNFGNAIAEIVEEKKKNFPYFSNAITEIVGKKKKVVVVLPKQGGKKKFCDKLIVAMVLPKQEKKYAYYSFNIFLTEPVWFVMFFQKQIRIDSSTLVY